MILARVLNLMVSTNEFFVELEKLIKQIRIDNKVPVEITETIQIPIPKKIALKDITDYRKNM